MPATGRRPTRTDARGMHENHMGLRSCGEGGSLCPRMSAWVCGKPRGSYHFYPFIMLRYNYNQYFFNTSAAFVPPKPKELLITTSTSAFRAVFGT